MERIEDRSKALSYIGIEIADALKLIPTPQDDSNEVEAILNEIKEETPEEKAGYESRMSVREAIENREHIYHSAYADIGMVLDNYTTDELIEYLKNNEPGGESSLRNYVESQIIGAQINRERYQSENNFVTESVTNNKPDEPDIEQTTGMRI